MWTARKGLYAAVAGARPTGSTALLEDIAVPVGHLAATCAGLETLFERHGYDESVIFGHAKDGNIHFLLNEHLDQGSDRLEAFTEQMVELVLDQGGNLKAEHGTGRVMAPFVERQYGTALYEVMREIKRLVDPLGILNPGVVLTDDPQAHMRDLKPVVPIEEEADRCVECGYCEPVCPSRDLTLTPRQRIVLRREEKLAAQRGDTATVRAIQESYDYEGLATCAVDGMCVTACPVGINTGDLVRRLRAEQAGPAESAAWSAAAGRWGAVTRGASAAVGVAGAIGTAGPTVAGRPAAAALPRLATAAGRALLGADTVPDYRPELPRSGGAVRRSGGRGRASAETVAVLMPSCTGTMFGPAEGSGPNGGGCSGACACSGGAARSGAAAAGAGASAAGLGVTRALDRLLERARVRAVVPEGIEGLCCGTPFSSKGMTDAKERMRARLREALVATARREGASHEPGAAALPVVVDAASCTEGVLAALEGTGIEVIDATTFVRRELLGRLSVSARAQSVTVHPTCSTTHLGATDDLVALAGACAEEVVLPVAWGCCAYAGDRGMLHPELTASATRAEAAEIAQHPTDWYVSANRTCELGMSAATGQTYRHVLELVEAATR
nr:FAD-linked oxidase C-terminal domain-containing protein [Brachybacterium equifaecis]